MEKKVRRIAIEDLRVGMYLEDVFNDRGSFLVSANTLITDRQQIAQLGSQGVKSVYINTTKGIDLTSAPESSNPAGVSPREVGYFQELPKAREVKQIALETAREVLATIQRGRVFSPEKIEIAAGEIVESLLRNPDALVSLCQIKGYDEYTCSHSVHVAVYVTTLGSSLGYDRATLLDLGVGGLLHDIGKMRVPESILNKPGRYADWEFEIMKKHPLHGLDIVGSKKRVSDLARAIIVQHHERYDGSGYPYGLKGEQIQEAGVISAVADVYDALTSDRVYRPAWTPQKALALIFQGCDKDYSRNIVQRFTKQIGVYPVGSFVRLLSGEMGIVTRIEEGKLLAPTVLVLFDGEGKRLDSPVEYDLARKQSGSDGDRYKVEVSLNPKVYRVNVSSYLGKESF